MLHAVKSPFEGGGWEVRNEDDLHLLEDDSGVLDFRMGGRVQRFTRAQAEAIVLGYELACRGIARRLGLS